MSPGVSTAAHMGGFSLGGEACCHILLHVAMPYRSIAFFVESFHVLLAGVTHFVSADQPSCLDPHLLLLNFIVNSCICRINTNVWFCSNFYNSNCFPQFLHSIFHSFVDVVGCFDLLASTTLVQPLLNILIYWYILYSGRQFCL